MKTFSKYDILGLITPGALFLALISTNFVKSYKEISDLSIGGLGLISILCFVTGHIIQAVGNLIEWVYFRFWGKPTDKILKKRSQFLSPEQIGAFEKQVVARYGFKSFKIEKQTKIGWAAIIRQVISDVSTQRSAGRLEAFNSNYGLFRGLLAAIILAIPVQIAMNGFNPSLVALDFGIGILIFARMHRFARHYAYELFSQFLLLKKK